MMRLREVGKLGVEEIGKGPGAAAAIASRWCAIGSRAMRAASATAQSSGRARAASFDAAGLLTRAALRARLPAMNLE